MALILNQDAQAMFFSKVFGPGHEVVARVKALIAAGVTFETGMLSVKAKHNGAQYSVILTTGTTALMKGTVDFPVAEQNKKLVVDWVDKLYSTIDVSVAAMSPALAQALASGETTVILTGGTQTHLLSLIKAIQSVTGLSLLGAKGAALAAIAGTKQELKTFPTYNEAFEAATILKAGMGDVELSSKGQKVSMASAIIGATAAVKNLGQAFATAAKPVDAVISLKDAQALGQKVRGTSPGSVYRCIALGEHVRLAAKLGTDGGISIRAEWTDNPQTELAKLKDAGVSMKQGYGSIHFSSAGVPVERVIGAFLVGAGIKWKAIVMNGAELVIGSAS